MQQRTISRPVFIALIAIVCALFGGAFWWRTGIEQSRQADRDVAEVNSQEVAAQEASDLQREAAQRQQEAIIEANRTEEPKAQVPGEPPVGE